MNLSKVLGFINHELLIEKLHAYGLWQRFNENTLEVINWSLVKDKDRYSFQKQPSRGALRNFIEITLRQWVFSCKFAAYFQNTFY